MPSFSQLALLGQSWPSDTLSDLGWFLEPVLIGRTAFMPNRRFTVVTKAYGDLYGLLVWLVWETCLLYLKWEGTVAQPHPSPILYLLHPLWLYTTPLLPQQCVCVCEWCTNCCVSWTTCSYFLVIHEQGNKCFVSVCVAGREGWVEPGDEFDSYSGGGNLTKHSIISKLMWKTWNGGQ